MNITTLLTSLSNCPCGKEHTVNIKAVEIGRGLLARTAEILAENGFPRKILAVADRNTLSAADGIIDILKSGGFDVKLRLYDNLREADINEVHAVEADAADREGILSIGTGSLNDICRVAALTLDLPFAIFATAPSMDGFASGTAPITENNFKLTRPARQPEIIIGDTDILAAAPAELKSAGFGDIIAKYAALADWRIANLTMGEYYCERIAELVRGALRRVAALCDRVTEESTEAAQALMETLILTGLAMKLAHNSVRPASGAEHVISHYWECKKLEMGQLSDFHGKKCGVATLIVSKLYHEICAFDGIEIGEDRTDWEDIYRVYGANFENDIKKQNTPTVTEETTPERVRENWGEICRAVAEELPTPDVLLDMMRRAGAAVTYADIGVSEALGDEGVLYHAYMRHRMTLMRLLPMTNFPIKDSLIPLGVGR
ncbi:MAG: sn-glycerol-1-phosphate dehydrogenase [Ruminococcaceae bacterium]|nr:sn-glycerol-1-phosphate dehydrogenase [Oscillospiraceae bacterium]